MATYVKVNNNQYPATIYGRMRDEDWGNRESKSIVIEMPYEEALHTFVDDIDWFVVYEQEQNVPSFDPNTGEILNSIQKKQEVYDNSEFSIAGDITNHRDGTVTVKMGKPTAEEILKMLEEVF